MSENMMCSVKGCPHPVSVGLAQNYAMCCTHVLSASETRAQAAEEERDEALADVEALTERINECRVVEWMERAKAAEAALQRKDEALAKFDRWRRDLGEHSAIHPLLDGADGVLDAVRKVLITPRGQSVVARAQVVMSWADRLLEAVDRAEPMKHSPWCNGVHEGSACEGDYLMATFIAEARQALATPDEGKGTKT
jgi:hypothetical protein